MAGGHGMWGLAHGPRTGRLLAEQITTGKQPEALCEFDPGTEPAARPSCLAVHTAREPARHRRPSRQGRRVAPTRP